MDVAGGGGDGGCETPSVTLKKITGRLCTRLTHTCQTGATLLHPHRAPHLLPLWTSCFHIIHYTQFNPVWDTLLSQGGVSVFTATQRPAERTQSRRQAETTKGAPPHTGGLIISLLKPGLTLCSGSDTCESFLAPRVKSCLLPDAVKFWTFVCLHLICCN